MRKLTCSYLILIICSGLFISACNKQITLQPPTSGGGGFYTPPPVILPEIRINNVAYGSHQQQVMDIFLPRGRSKSLTKIIFLIHGGQWVGGDKSEMEGYISLMKERLPDFAFVSLNYRMVNGTSVLMPALEEDIGAALQFLWSLSDSFNISQKTVLLGESAGGHLALLNAYKSNFSQIRVAIAIKSPSDLVHWYNTASNPQIKPMLEFITGGTPAGLPQLYYSISPANFVNSGDPATLLIHGDGDGFVNTQQSVSLSSRLETNGVFQQLTLLPGEAHALSLNAQLQVYEIIIAFLGNSLLFH